MTQLMEPGAELAGRYRLEAQLGSGGMGQVWRGHDLRLGRAVAIKLLRPGLFANEQALARFQREGKATARLNHPAIAAVYDVSAHQGKPFLVLELLDGHDLETALARNPQGLAIDQVLDCGAQIAGGLAAAHAAGVVHRDIKPANVMLLPGGQIKIYDFGIARLHDATRLTAADSAVGTLSYMAPEQFRNEPIEDKADLYALGATLFHLLTGHPPYRADDQRALIAMHLDAPVPSARSVRPGIPPAFDAYLRTLLAKDPLDRPDAATVAHHLPTLADPHRQPTEQQPVTGVRVTTTPASRIRNLLTEAEHLARTDTDITPRKQGRLWREIATILADRDPDHARDLLTETAHGLLAEAEHLARTDTSTSTGIPLVDFSGPRRWSWLRWWKAMTTTVRWSGTGKGALRADFLSDILGPRTQSTVRYEMTQTTGMLAGLHPVGAERLALSAAPDDPRAQAGALAEVAGMLTDRDPQQAQRILAKAERLARTLTNPLEQASALVPVVSVLARLDPAQAERLALTIPEPYRTSALVEILKVVLERDPDQAERLASTVPQAGGRAQMLARIADVLAPEHPDRARALLTEARALTASPQTSIKVLIALANVTTGQDPRQATELLVEAERLALDHDLGEHVIREIAEALAPLDAVEAERLARTLTGPSLQTRALTSIVKVQAKHDLVDAVYLAQTILQSPELAERGGAEAVAAVAEQDTAQAMRLARTLTDPRIRLKALMAIAKVTAGKDPLQATELLVEAEHFALDHDLGPYVVQKIVEALAPLDTARAERLARTLTDPYNRLEPLIAIAKERAEPDPDHAQQLLAEAEHLAHALHSPLSQASALVKIAQLHASCPPQDPPQA
ncbi:serine/threonine-protein kinase [Streptomyces lincolnensis]|uniref:serine/threonine-protein kinase n=1 Tax=Streptomyces lincolnensis TaxID=1915 RepID=UPI0037D93E4F